jgi:hypothetical protein
MPGLASINIINASSDIPSTSVSFVIPAIPFYKQQALVNFGSSGEYGEPEGAVPLTLISSSDTTHYIFQNNLNLVSGGLYSFYIFGNVPNVQTMLIRDHIPVHRDSVSGVRFVNLSPDAGSVNVTLQGGTTNDFSSIAYKSITDFKSYTNTSSVVNNGGYTFQVTDAAGNVLTTFNWSPQVFQNNTLVIGGSEAQGNVQIFQVNNY